MKITVYYRDGRERDKFLVHALDSNHLTFIAIKENGNPTGLPVVRIPWDLIDRVVTES